jgi:hypothetical protein
MSSPLPHLSTVTNRDGAAILDVSRRQIMTLNSTGAYIWDKLQHGKTVNEVVRDLAHECSADPLVVARDVQIFLEQLKAKHLLDG